MRFFSAPLGHKVTALLLAIAVAGGLHTWFRHNAVKASSAAELSFDADAARPIDPAVADSNQPAIKLAQSMLSDDVVTGLSKQAYLSASDIPGRMSEFRSRLELTQPSAQVLDVRFRDPDPDKATETANAVANALAAWTPPATLTPAPTPLSKPVAAPPAPAPVKKPVAVHHDQAGTALAAALGELEGQLSSTSRKVDGLNSPSRQYGGHSSHYGGHAYGRSSYSQSQQQQMLKSGVRTAQKKVDDLRAQYANGDAGAATKERLGAIREALSAVLSGGGGRYRAAGVSASQLREERAQLTHAISVVATERRATERDAASAAKPESDESAQAAAAPAVSAPAVSAPGADAAPAPAPTPSQSPAGPAPMASVVGPSSPGPLRLLRLAGSPAPTLWWPSALAGLVCGLLYWSVAAWPSRTEDEAGYGEETPHFSARFITPDEPVVLTTARVTSVAGDEVFDRAAYKRASFSYEPPPSERYFSAAAPAVAAEQVVQEELVVKNAATPGMSGIDPGPMHEPLEAAPVQEALAADAHENSEPTPVTVGENPESAGVRENPDAAPPNENLASTPTRENVVEMADPWAELMRKAISETEIGRRFEGPSSRGEAAAKDKERLSSRSDRLAG
jgi:hypothetical protein